MFVAYGKEISRFCNFKIFKSQEQICFVSSLLFASLTLTSIELTVKDSCYLPFTVKYVAGLLDEKPLTL